VTDDVEDRLGGRCRPEHRPALAGTVREEFDQGPVTAAQAMAAAAKKDINVQLIYCGTDDPTWRNAARLAHSDLFNIDQNYVAKHIPAPQDDQILALSQQLNDTYLAYGEEGAASMERQSKADSSSAAISKKVAIERAQLKAKPTYKNEKWDLVDAHKTSPKMLEKAPDAKLPTKMQGKSIEEKVRIVEKATADRAELQTKIGKLEAERRQFLDAEQKKQAGDAQQSLETELMKSASKAAAQKGYKP
jgi:hypothetical protein